MEANAATPPVISVKAGDQWLSLANGAPVSEGYDAWVTDDSGKPHVFRNGDPIILNIAWGGTTLTTSPYNDRMLYFLRGDRILDQMENEQISGVPYLSPRALKSMESLLANAPVPLVNDTSLVFVDPPASPNRMDAITAIDPNDVLLFTNKGPVTFPATTSQSFQDAVLLLHPGCAQ